MPLKMWRPNSEKRPASFRIWPPKHKVEIKFYVDSENFIKSIETLLISIVLNEINCADIANWDIGDSFHFCDYLTQNPELSRYSTDIHRECKI